MVADELPAAAQAAGVDAGSPELSWSLAAVGAQPATDEEVAGWWRRQRREPAGDAGSDRPT